MLAEVLDWPHASAVSELQLGAHGFRARRGIEGAVEICEGSLPVVITCEKGLNEPRYASLKGIMQAKKKPIAVKGIGDVGIDAEALARPGLVWDALELPAARSGALVIDGSAEEAAAELVRRLREEAKVI
jgi:electron transfer flavoprotein beta subunit